MNWGDPNFVALFAAWGQWVGGIGAVLAVAVAIVIALRSSKETQKQSLLARYDAARPVLVIEGNDPTYETDPTSTSKNNSPSVYIAKDSRRNLLLLMHTQAEKKGWIDWNSANQSITLKNVGTGVAFNVMSVIFGPESLEDDGKILDASKNDYWQHKINILSIGESKGCSYYKALQHLLQGHLNGYTLLAPPQPIIDPSDKKRLLYEDWVVCRVTTTYSDIFKRKHASIFDLDIRGFWIMRAFLEDIPNDLYDLQKGDQSSRSGFLAKRLKFFSLNSKWSKQHD